MKRSLPAQFLLGAFIAVSVLLLAAVFLEANRDRSVLLRQFDATARRNAALLLHSIEQPMARGDDAGTAAEFGKIAENFPGLHFSIASFQGVITYSTRPGEIRAKVEEAHGGSLAQSYLDALDGRFSGPGGVAAGQEGGHTENGVFTRLIKKDGRNQVLLLAPIENRPECYHCHGWSEPVLGAAALFTDVEDELAAFSRQSLALGGYALVLAALVTAVLYFFMRRRFFRRLDQMTALVGRISDWEDAGPPAPDSGEARPEAAYDPLEYTRHGLEKVSQLMEHLDWLESVLESLPLAVAVCDVQGRTAFVSRAFSALLGQPGEQAEQGEEPPDGRERCLGRPLAELVYGRPHANSIFAQMLRGKTPALSREESLARPGGPLRLRLDATLVYAGSSLPGAPLARLQPEIIGQPKIAGILCIFSDIDEEKRNGEALTSYREELSNLYRNAGLALESLRQAASTQAERLERARAAAADQQESARAEAQATYSLTAALDKLAGHWQAFMDQVGAGRQLVLEGGEDLRGLSEDLRELGRAVLRFKEEAESLAGQGRSFVERAQSTQEIADSINLLALDTALEAAAANIGPSAGRGASARKKAAGPDLGPNTGPSHGQDGEVLTLFNSEPRRGRPRKGEGPAANQAAAAVLGALVDRLRALADISGQAAEELKSGLGALNERAKNSLAAAEDSTGHMDALARLLLEGGEKTGARLEKIDALLENGAKLEAELRERLADGESLNRQAAKNGTLALQTLQAVQEAEADTTLLLSIIGRLEEFFPADQTGLAPAPTAGQAAAAAANLAQDGESAPAPDAGAEQ